MASLGDIVIGLRMDNSQFSAGANAARGTLASLKTAAGGIAGGIGKGVSAIGGTLMSIGSAAMSALGPLAAIGTVAGAIGGASFGVSLVAQAETAQASFETLLADEGKARWMLAELKSQGDKGLGFDSVSDAAKTMLSFGMAEDKILSSTQMLGEIAGGNKEKFGSLSLAYSQVSATGRLMGQDLLQLINAGFNPLSQISKTTGESMGDLKKRMEAGLIPFSEVEQAFRAATSEGGLFFGMTDKMSGTLAGKFTKAQSRVNDVLRTMGEELVTSLDIKGWLDWIGNQLPKVSVLVKSAFSTLVPIVQSAWGGVVSVFGQIGSRFQQTFGVISWDGIVQKATEFGSWYLEYAEAVWSNVASFTVGTFDFILSGFDMLRDGTDAALQAIGDAIGTHLDLSTATASVSDAVGSIPFMFRNAGGLIEASVIDWNLYLIGFADSVGSSLGQMGEMFSFEFTGFGETVSTFISSSITWLDQLVPGTSSVIDQISALFTGLFDSASQTVASFVPNFGLEFLTLPRSAGDALGLVGSLFIATFDGAYAAFGAFFQNLKDGFVEIGNVAQAVWEGIKESFNTGSFTAGYEKAIKTLAEQKPTESQHFTTAFADAFRTTLKDSQEGLADQGGYQNTLETRKTEIQDGIAASEATREEAKKEEKKKREAGQLTSLAKSMTPIAEGEGGEKKNDEGKDEIKKKDMKAALIGSSEAASIMLSGVAGDKDKKMEKIAQNQLNEQKNTTNAIKNMPKPQVWNG